MKKTPLNRFASETSEKARIWKYLITYDNVLIDDIISALKIKKENIKQYLNALALSKHVKLSDGKVSVLKKCVHYPFFGNGIVTDVDTGEKFYVYRVYKRKIRRVPSGLDFSLFCDYLSNVDEFLSMDFLNSLVANPEIDVPEKIIKQAGRRYILFLEKTGAIVFTGEVFRNSRYFLVDKRELKRASKLWWTVSEKKRMKSEV